MRKRQQGAVFGPHGFPTLIEIAASRKQWRSIQAQKKGRETPALMIVNSSFRKLAL